MKFVIQQLKVGLILLVLISVCRRGFSQMISTGAPLHIDSSQCYINDNFISTNWANTSVVKGYGGLTGIAGWQGTTSSLASIPAQNRGSQAIDDNGDALKYTVLQCRSGNYNDTLGLLNLKNLYQTGNVSPSFSTFNESQVQSYLQLPTLPSVGKMILYLTTAYSSSSTGIVVESKQGDGTWVQVAKFSYPAYDSYISLDTIAGNNIISQTPVTYRLRSTSYNSTSSVAYGPLIGALLVQKYIPNDVRPPYRPYNPITYLTSTISTAENIVNSITESQWLDLVPSQAPRSLQENPVSTGNPVLSTWNWSVANPNQISDGLGNTYTYGHSPYYLKNQVMTGDTIIVPFYKTINGDTTLVDAQIDFQKANYLNTYLPVIGSAYRLSGNEKYARYVALALDKWAKIIPKYFMTRDWNNNTPIDRDYLIAHRTTIIAQRASDHNGFVSELNDGPILAFDYIYDSKSFNKLSSDSGYDVRNSITTNYFLNISNWLITVPTVEQHASYNLVGHIPNMIRVAEVCPDTADKRRIMQFIDNYFYTVMNNNFKRDGMYPEAFSYHRGYADDNDFGVHLVNTFFTLFPPSSNNTMATIAANNATRVAFFDRADAVQDSVAFPNGDLAPFDDTHAGYSNVRNSTNSYLLPAYGHAMLGSGTGNQQIQYNIGAIDKANHIHNDMLAMTLFANGNEQLGSIRYSRIPGRVFTNCTLAKNLVTVDQNTSQFYSSNRQVYGNSGHVFTNGYYTLFEPGTDSISVLEAYSNTTNPGIVSRYQRLNILNTVNLSTPYLIDVFVVQGGTKHDYTLNGSTQIGQYYTSSLPLSRSNSTYPMLPTGQTYTPPVNLEDSRNWYGVLKTKDSAQSNGNWNVTFKDSTGTDGIKIMGIDDGTPMINVVQSPVSYRRTVASTFDYYKRPALIEQRVGVNSNTKSVFVHVIEPFSSSSAITSITRLPITSSSDELIALKIQFTNGRSDVALINLNHELITSDTARQTITTADSVYSFRGKVGIFTNVNNTVKGYLFNGRNISYNGLSYSPADSIYSGTITGVTKKVNGDTYDALITDANIPEGVELKGKWISVRFGDFSVIAPANNIFTQTKMNELFQIDGIKKVNGKTYILCTYDHGLNINGNITQELMRPQRTFVGTNTFTINKSKSVTFSSNGLVFTPPALTAAIVARVDSNYSILFPDDANWRSAITSISFGNTTLNPSTDYSLSAGQLTITPNGAAGTLLRTVGSFKIKIIATGYLADSISQSVACGNAAVLSVSTQPLATAAYSGTLAIQPVINILDSFGNQTNTSVNITASVNSGSSWTIGGTITVAAVNGIATFSNLSVNATSIVNSATILFAAFNVTSTVSASFKISPPVYYWVGGTTKSWWNKSVWSTTLGGTAIAAFAPAKTDIFIFDGTNIGGGLTGTVSVGSGYNGTFNVGQIILQNNANIQFTDTSSKIYAINGLLGDDFIIDASSTLTTTGGFTTNLQILKGATASISGNLILGQGSASYYIMAADKEGISVNNGGIVTVQSFTSSTPFTGSIASVAVPDSNIVFQLGGKLINKVSGDIFGGTGHTSVEFKSGSIYELQNNYSGALTLDGRTLSNFIFNSASSGSTVAGSLGISFDSVSITNHAFTITSTGINNHIRGNINIASGTSLIFNPTSAATMNLDGNSIQTITNNGTLTIPLLQTLAINNANGVSLNSILTTLGAITLTNGLFSIGNYNLTVASISGNNNAYINTNGTGKLTISSVATNVATTFPIGTTSSFAPLVITKTVGSSGNLSAAVQSTFANTLSNATKAINLQWTINSAVTATATIVYQFNSSDQAANFSNISTCELGIYNAGYTVSSVGTPAINGTAFTLSKTGNSLSSNTNLLFVIGNTNAINASCFQGTWFGSDNADANLPTNWCNSVLPTASTNIIIANTSPRLSANLTVNNFSLSSGILLNGNTFTVNGAISGTGTITGSATSSMNILGSGTIYFNQSQPSITNTLNNLAVNTSGTVTLGNALNILGIVRPLSGVLASAGNLTLVASSNGIARVTAVGGSITGNVTTQLFIPSKSARKYSFIGSTVSQQINNAWQQQIYITGVGSGGTVCGTNGTQINNNGFDRTPSNTPSMFTYNAIPVNGSRWVSVPNTNASNLTPGIGYRVNIRGDRNQGDCNDQLNTNNSLPPTNVLLSATGPLSQGNITLQLNDTALHKYTLFANPYPNPISFTSFQSANSAINNKMWTYSPRGNGNYTTYANGIITNGASGYDNAKGDNLAIGQAFFVEANSTGTSVTFSEGHKTEGAIPNFNYFGNNKVSIIRLGLMNSLDSMLDETVISYNGSGSEKYNQNLDAISFGGGQQGISTLKDSNKLAIATRPITKSKDSVAIAIKSNNISQFQLKLKGVSGFDSSLQIMLIDRFIGIYQYLKVNDIYKFNVTNDSLSKGNNRFVLLVNKSGILPITFTNITAERILDKAVIKFKVSNEGNVQSYQLQRSVDEIHYSTVNQQRLSTNVGYYTLIDSLPIQGNCYYRIQATESDRNEYSTAVSLKSSDVNGFVTVYPTLLKERMINIQFNNLPLGKYFVIINNGIGQHIYSTTFDNWIGTGKQQVDLSSIPLVSGSYYIQIQKGEESTYISRIVVE